MKIGIIDYGVGNLASVKRALDELSNTPLLINRAIDAHNADALILPGVGSFTDCMQILDSGGWSDVIREEVLIFKKPLLGICLGMQLLADSGEEGADQEKSTKGLGLVPGKVVSLYGLGCKERVPHVGWNSVSSTQENSLFCGIPSGTDFYFVHSYAFVPDNPCYLLATVDYGITVAAAVGYNHVWGTQFHPEKSSKAGFQILKNFVERPLC